MKHGADNSPDREVHSSAVQQYEGFIGVQGVVFLQKRKHGSSLIIPQFLERKYNKKSKWIHFQSQVIKRTLLQWIHH